MRQMKDSGIAWVGEIPQEWDIQKNKYIFKIKKDIVLPNKSYQLLSLTTNGIREKDEDDCSGKVPENYDGYQIVRRNDLVMCLFDLDCSAVFSGISSNLCIQSRQQRITPISCTNIIKTFSR